MFVVLHKHKGWGGGGSLSIPYPVNFWPIFGGGETPRLAKRSQVQRCLKEALIVSVIVLTRRSDLNRLKTSSSLVLKGIN